MALHVGSKVRCIFIFFCYTPRSYHATTRVLLGTVCGETCAEKFWPSELCAGLFASPLGPESFQPLPVLHSRATCDRPLREGSTSVTPPVLPTLRASVPHLPPVQTQQNSNPLSTNSRKGSPSANPSTRQQPLFQMSGKACCRPRPGLAKDDAGGVRHFGRQRLGHALPNVGAGISGRCWVQFWNERRARPVCHFQVIPIHSPFEAGFRPCLNSSNALHHRLRRTSCPFPSTHAGTPLATTDWSHP